jgi:serine protease AprX
MDQGVGTPATYTECFQFFIAPTDLNGQNPNPALRPHVINNSWQCRPSQGCAPDTLRTIIENAQAARIFVEAAVSGGGPDCSTITDPPAIYAAAFSTGAVYDADFLAPFSSRGPVTIDGSGRIKPDIVASGVNVRSSVNNSDSAYSFFTGTSMAGPHVVGVVALLWSARPELARDIAATKQLLGATASPIATVTNGTQCGGIDHVPNNHFGWGSSMRWRQSMPGLLLRHRRRHHPRRRLHLLPRRRRRHHLRPRRRRHLRAASCHGSWA